MQETDRAYIAGLFDGEGHVSVQWPRGPNGKRYKRLYCQITQRDPAVLEWIRSELGRGSICEKHDKRELNKCYDLRLGYRQAEAFLVMVLPYLRIKRDEAIAALEEAYGTKYAEA